MQKRKGFTLVELVIVIAVIAILAGVLIGTFASVINRANESARVQEVKAQEIQQKADDILKKIEDSNWYGWEDFETSIVAKLTKAYKENSGAALDTDAVKSAVTAAMNEYAAAHAGESTSLTEAQVKAIVENALGTLKFEGVTEAQVKTIINEATSNVLSKQLTEAQVKAVVEAANAKNLTAAQVSAALAEGLKDVVTTSQLDTKLATAVETLTNSIPTTVLTKEEVAKLIEELVPVTVSVDNETDFNDKVASLNSGSTIVWTGAEDATLNLATEEVKTLTIKGKIGTLNVTAPKATVYVLDDVTNLNVVAVANDSLHIFGTIKELVVNKGRAVLEAGAKLTGTLKAAPSASARVIVEIGQGVTIAKLVAEYQKNGDTTNDYIEVSNKGTVEEAQLTLGTPATGATKVTTNVRVVNEEGAEGTKTVGTNAEEHDMVVASALSEALQADANAQETPSPVSMVTVVSEGEDKPDTYEVTTTGEVKETETTDTAFWGELYATSFAGGTGSVVDPYQISTAAELMRLSYLMLAEATTYRTLNYVLTADIDLSGKAWMPISAYGRATKLDSSATEGSTYVYWFNGTFDGQGHTITGLTDKDVGSLFHKYFTGSNSTTIPGFTEYTFGLFGSVYNATIKNISFVNVSITNTIVGGYVADSVAAAVGFSEGSLSISNISVQGTITATDGVGAIVGRAYNANKASDVKVSVSNCTTSATLNGVNTATGGYSHVSGIVGIASKANNGMVVELTNNTNTGSIFANVKAGVYAGGIAYVSGATVVAKNNTSTANISYEYEGTKVEVSAGIYGGTVTTNENNSYTGKVTKVTQ